LKKIHHLAIFFPHKKGLVASIFLFFLILHTVYYCNYMFLVLWVLDSFFTHGFCKVYK
jgi:hypothetical protein